METRQHPIDEPSHKEGLAETNWGPWLFRLVLLATLVFFWWLVIYDHGVTPTHG
jgi:hypothetical protein